MAKPVRKNPASLSFQFMMLLAGVATLILIGISTSAWYGWHTNEIDQTRQLKRDAELTRTSLNRRMDYYHQLIERVAHDPELIDLLRVGSLEEQQAWAISRRDLIPCLLGLTLLTPSNTILGDANTLRIGPQCQRELLQPNTHLLLHREFAGAEHLDFITPVMDTGGTLLGKVFLSVRVSQLQRVVEDSVPATGMIRLADAHSQTIVQTGRIDGARRSIRLSMPDHGWTLVVEVPYQRVPPREWATFLIGALTLVAILGLLIWGMLRLRNGMFEDLYTTHDALAALARGEPLRPISLRYTEFTPIATDINLVAQALDTQHRQLEQLSFTDALTGLPNRRAFEVSYQQLAKLSQRYHPIALVLLDIDFFKRVNDEHGHAAGDQVLVALARAFKTLNRQSDLYARFAGDEFVALLMNTNVAGINLWYQRLADHFRVETEAFPDTVRISLSAGQTWLSQHHDTTLEAALNRADQALYRAKAQGRGQIVIEPMGTSE